MSTLPRTKHSQSHKVRRWLCLPLTFLGATVDIGAHPGHGLSGGCCEAKTETGRVTLPGQDHMYPFGIIGVAPRFIPAGAVSELAGIRLSCTSTRPTSICRRNTEGEIEFETRMPVVPNCAPFRPKSLGDCTRPLLNQYISWSMCVFLLMG
jgi:hypothetical protein